MNRWLVRWLTITVAYAVTQLVVGALLLSGFPSPGTGALPAGLLSHALVTTVVMLLAARLPGRWPQRAWVTFVLLFGIQVNNLAEASVFSLDIPRRMLPLLYVHGLLTSAALSGVATRLTPAPDAPPMTTPPPPGTAAWIARLLACSPVYVVVYVAAGMLAWPFVKPFYDFRPMPTMNTIVLVQIVRGLVFAGLLAYLSHHLVAGRRAGALLGGLALAVISAAPLLPPNPYMPAYVRMAHLCEVGVSNFAFGAFVTWLLARPALTARL